MQVDSVTSPWAVIPRTDADPLPDASRPCELELRSQSTPELIARTRRRRPRPAAALGHLAGKPLTAGLLALIATQSAHAQQKSARVGIQIPAKAQLAFSARARLEQLRAIVKDE